ncbi:MAG: Na/Pi symporter [Lentisphaeria bacterium]|nr:Na/Pi symporter [Lentisphaeria bacterium]
MDEDNEESQLDSSDLTTQKQVLMWLQIICLVWVLITAVTLIGGGFKQATSGQAQELFKFATNPIMGVIVGTVATAMIQSSSTVTSIIVGLVAGGLPVNLAVPMIMGANMGTTITNTIVSIGHIRDKEEFQRAFSAATIHDFFNLMCILIFLPIEIMFKPLEKMAGHISQSIISEEQSVSGTINFVGAITKPVLKLFQSLFSNLDNEVSGLVIIFLGVVLIFGAIYQIGRLMKSLMVGKARKLLKAAIGRGPISGIMSGTIVTILVQSSSTTTSLIIPLVGAGVLKVRDVYAFTLGANIGTCITALIAAMGVTGDSAGFALQIALVHLLYNFIGVIAVYGIPFLREIPYKAAERLALKTCNNKLIGFGYIAGIFFIFPAVAILLQKLF